MTVLLLVIWYKAVGQVEGVGSHQLSRLTKEQETCIQPAAAGFAGRAASSTALLTGGTAKTRKGNSGAVAVDRKASQL